MSLLHPFIPFITEEIWQRLKNPDEESIVISDWPIENSNLLDKSIEKRMEFLQGIISNIRTIRSEMNVPPSKKAQLIYRTNDDNSDKLLLEHSHYLKQLAGIESIEKYQSEKDLKSTATAVVDKLEIFIPLAGLIDLEVEKQRMKKEIDRISRQISGLEKKLTNENFLNKAPENVVNQEKEKMTNFNEKLKKLNANFNRLN